VSTRLTEFLNKRTSYQYRENRHRMKRISLYTVFIVLMTSCISGMKIHNSIFKSIDSTFSGTYSSRPYKIYGDGKDFKNCLLDAFKIYDVETDSVNFKFDSNGLLNISYKVHFLLKTKTFKGILRKDIMKFILVGKEL